MKLSRQLKTEFLNQGRYLLDHGYKSFLALFGMHDDVFSLEG